MTGIEREMTQSEERARPADIVSVEIYDAVYHLRGSDAGYISGLAELVDGKMRAVASQGGTVDSLRVAVLAALNIADELECLRERYRVLARTQTQAQTTMRSRSASLAGMLDEVLDEPIRRAG